DFSKLRPRSSLRFDFSMVTVQFLECRAAKQLAILPCRPQSNFRLSQRCDIQRMDARGRREQRHAAKVLLQQLAYLRSSQIVYFDMHKFGPLGWKDRFTLLEGRHDQRPEVAQARRNSSVRALRDCVFTG